MSNIFVPTIRISFFPWWHGSSKVSENSNSKLADLQPLLGHLQYNVNFHLEGVGISTFSKSIFKATFLSHIYWCCWIHSKIQNSRLTFILGQKLSQLQHNVNFYLERVGISNFSKITYSDTFSRRFYCCYWIHSIRFKWSQIGPITIKYEFHLLVLSDSIIQHDHLSVVNIPNLLVLVGSAYCNNKWILTCKINTFKIRTV